MHVGMNTTTMKNYALNTYNCSHTGIESMGISLALLFLRMDGESNDKPMAMQSWSVARSQHWTTLLIRTGSLSALDVNSTGNNQP